MNAKETIKIIIRVFITLSLLFWTRIVFAERFVLESDYLGQTQAEGIIPVFTFLIGFITIIYALYLMWRDHYINLAICVMILLLLAYNYYQFLHIDKNEEKISQTQTVEQQTARKNKGLANAKELAGKQFIGNDGARILFYEDGSFEFYPSEYDKVLSADKYYGDSAEIYYGQDAVEYYAYDSAYASFSTVEEMTDIITWGGDQVSDYCCLTLNIEKMKLEDYKEIWFYGDYTDGCFATENNISSASTEYVLEEQ